MQENSDSEQRIWSPGLFIRASLSFLTFFIFSLLGMTLNKTLSLFWYRKIIFHLLCLKSQYTCISLSCGVHGGVQLSAERHRQHHIQTMLQIEKKTFLALIWKEAYNFKLHTKVHLTLEQLQFTTMGSVQRYPYVLGILVSLWRDLNSIQALENVSSIHWCLLPSKDKRRSASHALTNSAPQSFLGLHSS